MKRQPRVALITDVVAHYRLPALIELSKSVDLLVVFSAESTADRPWFELPRDLPFRYALIRGLTVHRPSGGYYLDPRLVRVVLRHKPDVILTGGYSFPSVYGALCAAIARSGFGIISEGTAHSEQRLHWHQRLSRKLLLRRVDVCIAISHAAADRFHQHGIDPERVFVAPYTMEIDRFWEVAGRRCSGAHPLRVLSVGRLFRHKGFDLLVRAFHKAAQQEPEMLLTIVGSGPEEFRLRSLVSALGVRNVVIRGNVAQSEMPEIYGAADAFVFPTLHDPFGMVLLEAAASGLALISSPYAGATRDVIDVGRSGLVVDPYDIDDLASAIVRLARRPDERERLGRAAYESTLERTPAATAAAYMPAIDAALFLRRSKT